MELLHICLERIEWQGNVSDWRSRLDQSLEDVLSRIDSETNSPPLLITAFQLGCLKDLCHAASAGEEAQTLLSAFALCDAFMPFNQWVEEGFLNGKHDKLTELARRHPESYTLLGASTARIPLEALESHLKAWEFGDWGETMKSDVGNTDRFRMYLKHRDALFREWIGLFSGSLAVSCGVTKAVRAGPLGRPAALVATIGMLRPTTALPSNPLRQAVFKGLREERSPIEDTSD